MNLPAGWELILDFAVLLAAAGYVLWAIRPHREPALPLMLFLRH